MDDKLFYVESPEGQVLGPMPLIQVLEGVAAGAVQDDARICEVGGSEWVSLSDVAYTRDDVADSHAVEEESLEISHAPESALQAVEEVSQQSSAWIEPPRKQSEPARRPSSDRLAAPRAPTPLSTPGLRHAPDLEPTVRLEYEPTVRLSPAADRAAEPVEAAARPPSGDFSLRMSQADESAPAPDDFAPPEERRAPPFLMPLAIAGAVAVIAGIYFAASGKLSSAHKPEAKTAVAAATAAPAAPDPVEAGWNALNAKDDTKALELLTAAVKAKPDDAHAHHGLGLAALATEDVELAVTNLQRAAALDPKNAALRVDLGRAQMKAGHPELAVEEAEKARSIDSSDVSVLLLLGRANAAQGHANEAVEALTAYTQKAPKDVDARRDLARALASAGRVETAIHEVEPYLDAHPEDKEMQVTRLDWMLSIGQRVPAARLYGPPADKHPDDAFAQYLAGRAGEGTEKGVAHLTQSVALDPSNRDAWIALGRAQAALGKNADAARAFEHAFTLGAPSAEETKLLAGLKKAAPAGIQVASKAGAESAAPAGPPPTATVAPPKVSTIADRVGEVRRALAREDVRAARRALDAAANELHGPEADRNLALWGAVVDFQEGHYDAAQKAFEKLDASATYVGFGAGAVANWLGRVQLARGDIRGAINSFDQVGPDDPDEYATAQLWEGVALSSLGMTDLAQRTWTRVKDDVQGKVGAQARAAVSSAQFLAGAIAEKDFRTAVAPVPEFENDMHFFLGWAVRTTNADAARAHFQEALETSHGHEFPWQLAESEIAGTGIGKRP
ncbi:MAG: tetratricopeptide repeat protein [bacterium]